ncbi:lytic transglycosylase domain-containing protein [Gorillibacterium sp. sgz5001074]|uniref:lytic transglycosylase domain-containing protein n=1 Tax=Gorillibacterium sp. sgz5001074 TaxID=3446695 RepID=UPI003F664884
MNIDPSIIKQLLQLQMQQGLVSSTETGTGFGSSGSEFADLLESLLHEGASYSGSKVIPAAELLARNTGALTPFYSSLQAYEPMAAEASADYSSYDDYIRHSSARNGVEPALVKAVIQAESDFDANAVSKAGAKGLMQLMDGTGQGLGVRNPFDPQQNIEGGTRFLSGLLKKYNGNEGVALAAYNAGPSRVDRLGIKTDEDLRGKLSLLPRETQRYVSKVLGFKEQYQA